MKSEYIKICGTLSRHNAHLVHLLLVSTCEKRERTGSSINTNYLLSLIVYFFEVVARWNPVDGGNMG